MFHNFDRYSYTKHLSKTLRSRLKLLNYLYDSIDTLGIYYCEPFPYIVK